MQAFARVRRVDGHISRPRLENGQQPYQGFQATARNDCHAIVRTYALVDQTLSQSIGLTVELRVGQVLPLKNRRHGIGSSTGLLFDASMNQLLVARNAFSLIPDLQLQLLGRCRQLEVLNFKRRVFQPLLQNVQQTPGNRRSLVIFDPGTVMNQVQRGIVVATVAAQVHGQRRRFVAIGHFYRLCLRIGVAVTMVFQLVGHRHFKQLRPSLT